jgi:hypothetical protein
MRILRFVGVCAFFGLGLGSIVLFAGCDSGGGGGGKGNFVADDIKVEKVNGMSPSEAFHRGRKK